MKDEDLIAIKEFLKGNLEIGLSSDETCITVRIWLAGELITESTDCLNIYSRNVYDGTREKYESRQAASHKRWRKSKMGI